MSVAVLHNILFFLEHTCVYKCASCVLVRLHTGNRDLSEIYSTYDVPRVWFASLAGWTTQLGPVRVCPRKGPWWEEGEERGREGVRKGHTHEPAVHPASGPHLELDTASPRAGRGNVRGRKNFKREKLSVFYRQ